MSDKYSKSNLEKIWEQLQYDSFSGRIIWKVTRNRIFKGQIAGTIDAKGYRRIRYLGDCYFAHQLAWFSVYGKFPKNQVDHINGIRDDNRINNLREVSCYENSQNQCIRKTHTLGYMGIRKNGNKFTSSITIKGKRKHLGSFDNPVDAHIAYKNAKLEHHKFFNENRRIKL